MTVRLLVYKKNICNVIIFTFIIKIYIFSAEARQAAIINQARTSTKLVDLLFNVKATTPDLRVIFPGISKDKLNRRSSAVWKTPPRYSMLPRF